MDLTEVEDIKEKWQEYTEELYKKDFHDPDNHDDVFPHTHLEPDILELEVKSALRRITTNKASGGGEAAPQPECCSVCAQKAPARPGLPWSCPPA